MSRPLYIVWQESDVQGEPIIDEQHRGVLATVNSLYYFLQQEHQLIHLMPTVKILLNYIIFHYKTEVGILKSMEYPHVAQYVQEMDTVIQDFKAICKAALKQDHPDEVLLFLKKWWFNHLDNHVEFTPYLNHWSGGYCRVDSGH